VTVKRYASTALTIVCVTVAGLGLYNVYADNADVLREAQRVACGADGPACGAQMLSETRTPFGQTFSIHLPTRTAEVNCRRAAILVGNYACTAK
jgi:hypothetical protein